MRIIKCSQCGRLARTRGLCLAHYKAVLAGRLPRSCLAPSRAAENKAAYQRAFDAKRGRTKG